MCIPDNPNSLILAILLIVNAAFLILYKVNSKYRETVFKKLIGEKELSNESYDENELREEIPPQHWFAWAFGVCVCLDIWIIGAWITHWWAGEYFTHFREEDNNKALFGDSFGAVNALISAFAFAGMIVAFILQRYELRLQRKELEAQRKEFETQNSTLKLQRFENTFFNMMELQQQIVNDLKATIYLKEWIEEDAPDPTKGRIRKQVTHEYTYRGRDLFLHAFNQAEHQIETDIKGKYVTVEGMRSVLRAKGLGWYDEYHTASYFDHYFRHFYRILKLVKQNSDWLTFDEQYKYTSMLRGTLSRYELVWLYYNGLSENGCEKLKPLMEEYSMLKSLRSYLLTLNKENYEEVLRTIGHVDKLKANDFSGTDFEFYLTEEKDNESKYYIGAFYNKDEVVEGRKKVEDWRLFCEQNNIRWSPSKTLS